MHSWPAANILNNFNGLPTHALLVHFAISIGAAAALGGLVYVLLPSTRRWLSHPLLAAGLMSVVLGILTPSSGEKLEARVERSQLLTKHTELGDQMGIILIAYGALLVVAMFVVRYRRRTAEHDAAPRAATTVDRIGAIPGAPRLDAFAGQAQLAAVLTVLILVGSIVSGVWMVRTGDAGAKSVWDDTPAAPIRPEG